MPRTYHLGLLIGSIFSWPAQVFVDASFLSRVASQRATCPCRFQGPNDLFIFGISLRITQLSMAVLDRSQWGQAITQSPEPTLKRTLGKAELSPTVTGGNMDARAGCMGLAWLRSVTPPCALAAAARILCLSGTGSRPMLYICLGSLTTSSDLPWVLLTSQLPEIANANADASHDKGHQAIIERARHLNSGTMPSRLGMFPWLVYTWAVASLD